MHQLTNKSPVNMGPRFGMLAAGTWLVDDRNAFEIGLIAERGEVKLDKWEGFKAYYPRRVLLVRSGAIGDLLFLTPAVRAYRQKHAGATIDLACFPVHAELFEAGSVFDNVVTYPYPMRFKSHEVGYDSIISLENFMEVAHDKHATDSFADALGVKVTDYKISYEVTAVEKQWASQINALKTPRPKLGIQMRASSPTRDYPSRHWLQIILEMERRGWAVFLFGLKGQIPTIPAQSARPDVHDVSNLGLNFRETAAMISEMDAFCGVDSSLLHLCSALEIPAIGLYAAFDWKTRTLHSKTTEVISGFGDCAPCNWHSKNGQHFPAGKPCQAVSHCTILAAINPDRVVRKIDALRPVHA